MRGIEFSKEVRQDVIGEIKGFFIEEREEEISDFQAANLLDFVLGKIGPKIYNQVITDSYVLMSQKIDELYTLERRRV